MYDMIVIGGGPAGLSAAITARARNKEVLVISNAAHKNPLAASKRVDNYPGMPEATGIHILETMQGQAEKMGAHFLLARALSLVPVQEGFMVTTSSDVVEGKTIVVASGAVGASKPLPGEVEFLGRGVSYCATCDGMFYNSSTVLVAGLSAEAAEEANFLAEIGATVHFVSEKPPLELDPRVLRYSGKLLSIEGDALGVTHATISVEVLDDTPDNGEVAPKERKKNSQEQQLEVNGVFILRSSVAPTSLLPSLQTDKGYIKVDAGMQTNIKGVFAAGDCTGKPMQVAVAVGQGQIAAFSAVELLTEEVRSI